MSTVLVSISLFIIRGFWVLQNSKRMNKKWVKIIPHVNDTILLISAIFLSIGLNQYPFTHNWLTAKFVALIVYIVLGMFALKHAKEKKNKVIFFVLALITFSYIVMVAMTRSANWFL